MSTEDSKMYIGAKNEDLGVNRPTNEKELQSCLELQKVDEEPIPN